MVDYIGSDEHDRVTYIFHHIPFVTDHSVVMQSSTCGTRIGTPTNNDVAAHHKNGRLATQGGARSEMERRHSQHDAMLDAGLEVQRACHRHATHETMRHDPGATTRHETSNGDDDGKQRLRDELHAARTQQQRTLVRRRLWQARRAIRAERQRQRLGQVLTHLGQGGWGKRDIMKVPPGLTILHNDNGAETAAPQEIAQKATEYYNSLFGPVQDDDGEGPGYGANVHELLHSDYNLWEWGIGVTSEHITAALTRCPRNKTTGWGDITTEQWQLAVNTNEEVVAALVRAINCSSRTSIRHRRT